MDGRRLPSLGERGAGWVLLQTIVVVLVLVGGEIRIPVAGPARIILGVVGIALIVAGVTLLGRASTRLGPAFTALPRPRKDASLVVAGPYRLVRHPIYGGLVIAGLGWSILWSSPASLIFTLVLFVVLDLKARREEAWLVETYGGYEAYRRGRRRMIPFLY